MIGRPTLTQVAFPSDFFVLRRRRNPILMRNMKTAKFQMGIPVFFPRLARAKAMALICAFACACLCGCDEKEKFSDANLQSLIDAAAAAPGKTLVLEDATYLLKEPLKLGNAHSGLTITAKGRATISGGRKVSGWQREGKLLKAKIDADVPVFSLFVNGRRAEIARHPDGDNFLWALGPSVLPTEASESSQRAAQRNVIMRNEDIAGLAALPPEELKRTYIDFYLAWYSPRIQIEKIIPRGDGKTSVVVLNDRVDGKYTQPFRFSQTPHYQIVNAKFALTQEGEFWFDQPAKTLYYFPRAGETAENIDAWYPVVGPILVAGGDNFKNPLKNLTLKNLKFQYGRQIPEHAGNNWSSATQAASYVPGFLRFSNSRGVKIENCEIAHCDAYGVAFGDSVWNSSIVGCVFYDNGAGGIRVGGRNASKVFDDTDDITSGKNLIENNIIYYYGRWNKAGVGILIFDSPDNIVRNNTIFDGYYTGISVGWNWGTSRTHSQNNLVEDNRIFNIGHGVLDDMGGIYVLGVNPNSVVRGNVISGVRRHNYGGWGLYNDANSSHYTWENNYVWDTDDGGYYKNFGVDNVLRNNIFVNGKYEMFGEASKHDNSLVVERNIFVYSDPCRLLRYDRFIPTKQIVFKNNIYWNAAGKPMFGKLTFEQWQQKGQDKGSFVLDPKLDFANPNPVFDKIGFKPFDVKRAGVKGEQKARLDEILKAHKFPELSKCPHVPPFPKEIDLSDLSEYKIGDMPAGANTCPNHHFRPLKGAIKVMEENGKRFIRLTDNTNEPAYFPYLQLAPIISDSVAAVSFKARLNKDSEMFVDVRGVDLPFGAAPAISFSNGKARIGGKSCDIPIGKWFDVSYEIPVGENAKREVRARISCDGKTLLELDIPYAAKRSPKAVSWLSFQMNGRKVCQADIADVKVVRKK